jgi:2,4-dienoyl-CoA reductase-like NADH-dependent reductase (Old Yellow Enzyme family)
VTAGVLFEPGRIGQVTTANRIVRAGTSETAAGPSGEITDRIVDIYESLARNRVGLILSKPIILVGGMRTRATMEEIIAAGEADFIAMARPFIREPDLVLKLAEGASEAAACTSCNLCLMHESHHSLRCWRTPRRRLLEHLAYRVRGGFRETNRPHG